VGLGWRVQGADFMGLGVGSWVEGLGFMVENVWFRV
jgi:hypothetical protein